MTVHKLIAAPVALQPGGYVKVAYEGRDKAPTTPSASLDLQNSGKGFRIGLQWKCPNPVKTTGSNTDIWVDACACPGAGGRGRAVDHDGKRNAAGRRRTVACRPGGPSCDPRRGSRKRSPSGRAGGGGALLPVGTAACGASPSSSASGPR